MRIPLALALGCLVASAPTSAQTEPRWIPAVQLDDGVVYVDQWTRRCGDRECTAWERWDYDTAKHVNSGGRRLRYEEIKMLRETDCLGYRYRVLGIHYYNASGESVHSIEEDLLGWQQVVPDTNAEVLFVAVCSALLSPEPAATAEPLDSGEPLSSSPRPTTHRVLQGENLTGIARRYGVTVREIMDWNNLRSSTVRTGQRLRILPGDVYEVADVMPELQGGLSGLQRRVSAEGAGSGARVFVQFVVDEAGRPTDIEVVGTGGRECDQAALSAIRASRFTPGLLRGRPVKVRMSLPVTCPASSTPRNGRETGGSSGLSIEGLGSRGATCPRPRYPGVSGNVTYAVTFAPDGRYVSSRPLSRGGDQRLDNAVRSVIAGCRAQALTGAASQVNQEGRVTFRFTR